MIKGYYAKMVKMMVALFTVTYDLLLSYCFAMRILRTIP